MYKMYGWLITSIHKFIKTLYALFSSQYKITKFGVSLNIKVNILTSKSHPYILSVEHVQYAH